MTFLEAISSGKPFRRPDYTDVIIENKKAKNYKSGETQNVKEGDLLNISSFVWRKSKQWVFFTKAAMLATDWESEE